MFEQGELILFISYVLPFGTGVITAYFLRWRGFIGLQFYLLILALSASALIALAVTSVYWPQSLRIMAGMLAAIIGVWCLIEANTDMTRQDGKNAFGDE